MQMALMDQLTGARQMFGGRMMGIEAKEEDDGFYYTLAAPGLRTEDLQATIDRGVLRLSGETKTDQRHVKFERAMLLPPTADVDSDEIAVTHEHGLVSIFVPKRELPEAEQARLLPVSTPKELSAHAKAQHEDDEGFHFSFAAPGLRTEDLNVRCLLLGETPPGRPPPRRDPPLGDLLLGETPPWETRPGRPPLGGLLLGDPLLGESRTLQSRGRLGGEGVSAQPKGHEEDLCLSFASSACLMLVMPSARMCGR